MRRGRSDGQGAEIDNVKNTEQAKVDYGFKRRGAADLKHR
jgi:hypothetical protein